MMASYTRTMRRAHARKQGSSARQYQRGKHKTPAWRQQPVVVQAQGLGRIFQAAKRQAQIIAVEFSEQTAKAA